LDFLLYFNQPKELIASEGYRLMITAQIYVKGMARRLKSNIGKLQMEWDVGNSIHKTSFYGLVTMWFAGEREFKHVTTYKIPWRFFLSLNLNRYIDEYIYSLPNLRR
jgi:hypothetical protein